MNGEIKIETPTYDINVHLITESPMSTEYLTWISWPVVPVKGDVLVIEGGEYEVMRRTWGVMKPSTIPSCDLIVRHLPESDWA